MSITLASADAEAAPGSWIVVQTVISTPIEIEGYDSPHEEATVQAGRATGQCERGGAAPGPGTSVGGHRRTHRLSSRNALLPLFWPRRPGRVPTGRAPARGGRNNRARRHNPPATSRPATVSDNRARRVSRGAARTMRRPALLRGSHRTTRNPDGRQGRAPRHATSKAPRRGRRHRPIHDQRLPRRCQCHPRGCNDRYAHALGRWPRHPRSRVPAGTDRPTRQERRTRLNKRAPRDLSIASAAPGLGHWIERQTGWSVKKFVPTARRYRTVQIRAGQTNSHRSRRLTREPPRRSRQNHLPGQCALTRKYGDPSG